MPAFFSKKNILNQPYPPPKGGLIDSIISFLFGLFIALFLVVFEPFDLNNSDYKYKTLALSFYGVITWFCMLSFFYLLPKIGKSWFSEEKWKVKHHIIYFCLTLFTISTFNGLYINYINNLTFNWANYWYIITRTFALGSIPISIIVIADHNRRLKGNLKKATELDQQLKPKENGKQLILRLEKKHEVILEDSSFLYIQADGNYITIHSTYENKLKSKLYRDSLNAVVDQLPSNSIQRCHRSFIVNLKKVSKVSGNAQGLKMELNGSSKVIPVSRKYISSIRTYLTSVE